MTLYPSAGSELALSGAKGQVVDPTEVTLAYTPPAGMGNTGVSADGFDLRKRGATVGWDAGVFDGQHAITQTGLAQVRVETKYSGYRLFGLTTSDIGGGFCPTRYGLELVHGGTLEIYENCVRVAYPPALVYGAGDQLRIEADAGVVRYKRQVAGAGTWQVLYTSTLPVTAALYFNASLYTPGSTLKEIRFVSGSTAAPSVNRTYYTFGGARVAMRDGAGAALVYLHGDQLGSASLATSMTGTVLSQQRYAPYGEVRWASGAGMPTDFTFTGQRAGPANYVGSLMDYVARGYSPALGRFISADTIVPGAGNSQAFNRYAYVTGRPLNLVDPSGNCGNAPGDTPCPIEEILKDSLTCQMDQGQVNRSSVGPVSSSTVIQGTSRSPDLSDKWMVDSGTYGMTFGPVMGAVGLRAIAPLVPAAIDSAKNLVQDCANNAARCQATGPTAARYSNITAMLGPFPQYVKQGIEGGYKYFNLGKFWGIVERVNQGGGWEANKAFLAKIVTRGESIVWAIESRGRPFNPLNARSGSGAERELDFLSKNGYKLWFDGYNYFSAIAAQSKSWTQVTR